tara:strand:+ start:3853 stop:5823 length:1971 start_codon:yes stop_codon:yes gene_type:complete
MKIKILTIKTIGLRCPDLAIDFPNKKNIHFLQMPNGTGKTTLINLIKNTLSNSWRNVNSFKSKDSKKSYGQFIVQLQIISDEIEDKITFRVELDFNSNTHKVFTTQNKISEKPGFHPSRNIKQFLTPSHIQTFLFSGDRLDDYFDETKDTVRETVDTFSGISKIKYLSHEIEQIFKAKMTGKISSSSKAYITKRDRLEVRLQELTDGLEHYTGKIEKLMPKWIKLNDLIDKREDVSEEVNSKIDSKQEEIDGNKEDLNECENELAEMMKNLYNVSPILKDRSQIFLNSLSKKELPGTSKEFFVGVSLDTHCICGSEMTKEKSQYIVENTTQYLGQEDVQTTNSINSINQANLDSADHVNYMSKVKELETLYSRFMALEDEMFDLTEHRDTNSNISKEIESFNALDTKKQLYEGLIRTMKEDKDETKAVVKNRDPENIRSIKGVNIALLAINNKIAVKEGFEKKDKKIKKFLDVLEVASEMARKNILEELKNEVNKKIHLSHQDTSFEIESIDRSLNIRAQEGGSGGQQVTAVTSFALSILERSGVEFPLVIDHPVTPLHYEARPAISKMLTSICDQSICFIINTEKPGFITNENEENEVHDFLEEKMSLHTIYRTSMGVRQPKEIPNKGLSLESLNGIVTSDRNFFLNFSLETEGS